MVSQHQGLVVTISFWAGQKYMANIAYGVAKTADDRMAADMALELRPHNVASVSLYPGLVRTEGVMRAAEHFDLSNSESPQFIGRAVAALAADPDVMDKSGQGLRQVVCENSFLSNNACISSILHWLLITLKLHIDAF